MSAMPPVSSRTDEMRTAIPSSAAEALLAPLLPLVHGVGGPPHWLLESWARLTAHFVFFSETTMAHELLAAWASGDIEAVLRLLQDEHVELDVDYQGYFDSKSETPLLAAIRGSHWDVVNVLVKHGADVRAFDKDGLTPLHLAVRGDWVDVVRLILNADSSGINDRDKYHNTPLHVAFIHSERNCAHELLKRGATTWGKPPLSVAAGFGHVDFARQLLRSRAVDVDEADADGWTSLHHAADQRQSLVIKLLLSKNADPNRRDKDGWTPLHRAALTDWWTDDDQWDWTHKQDLEALQELLACGQIDVNAVTKDGRCALHFAAKHAWDQCVDLLVRNGANVNTVGKFGRTPLFDAIEPVLPPDGADPIPCVTRLIRAGADVNVSDEYGITPLLVAVKADNTGIVELLVKKEANVNVVTKDNDTPLSIAIQLGDHKVVELLLESGADMAAPPVVNHSMPRPQALTLVMRAAELPADCFVAIARSLCARGSKWDESCENEASRNRHADWCSGMRASVEHWAKQFNDRVDSLTEIPFEVVQKGAKSVASYVERIARNSSKALLQRCKVCVIGPTEWGKTSLVKALTTGEAASVDPGVDGRTVGIDLETLKFTDRSGRSHEVTLWDFAGQHEYQGAHSLFFSPRSLYLLCIDLNKYDEALKTFGNNKHAMEKFMRDNIFRWVQTVSARHANPTFVAVGTKLDLIDQKERVNAIWNDLEDRWRKWTGKLDVSVELEKKKIEVNNYDPESVSTAIREIKTIVTNSRCSIGLPADDVRVLEWIRRKRDEVSALSVADHVRSTMWFPVRLQNELLKDIANLEKAEDILELLHELGDVYWNKSDDGNDTIIIDTSLLLEFVKEIITHNCDKDADKETKEHLEKGRICHKTLSQFPHWKLVNDEVVFALKRLLQQLRLAYPSNSKWDSDLIVPAYWKRRAREPPKGLLRDRSMVQRRGVVATCEYWLVYKVSPELSDVVFEQFAVRHQKFRDREIWANVIEDTVDGCVATATLEHSEFSTVDEGHAHNQEADSKQLKASRAGRCKDFKILDTINLQVTGSGNADKYLLEIFDAMEKVIEGFRGVGVSLFVRDHSCEEDHTLDELSKEMDLCNLRDGEFFSSRAWVPPNFRQFLYKPRERTFVRAEESLTGLQSTMRVVDGKMDTVLANSSETLTKQRVLVNLARATDTQRQYPARWELMYDQKLHKAELRVLCDLKEKCHLDPKTITISVPPNFLAKHSTLLRGCVGLMDTFAQGFDPTGIVSKLASELQAKIDLSGKMHEMVSVLDLSQGGTTLAGEKVTEPVAAWILHEILTLHDPSFKVEQLPRLSGLIPTTNDDGTWIWVHDFDLDPTKCVPESKNVSSSGVSGDPPASASHDKSEDSDEEVQQPEDEDDPNNDATVAPGKEAKKVFSAHLRVLGISGLNQQDERGVYCDWALQNASVPTQVFCSATTPRHSDKSQAPSWEDIHYAVRNIASLKQLGECNLRLEVKRPHTVKLRGDDKSLFSGSIFLAAQVLKLQDDAKPRTVVVPVELDKTKKVTVELDKTKKVTVKCEFTLA